MTTRNEELVESLLSRHDGSAYAPALHQRVLGFTLDETASYLRASLLGAGSDCFDDLMLADLIVEIQAFTQGIVGDLDALMYTSLDILAKAQPPEGKGPATEAQSPALTLAVLKAAAARLHLKFEPSAWKARRDELLAPGAVRESAHTELKIEAARLFVSSGGRSVAEVSLNRPRMILGRDVNCDISLDSSYVSRYQNLFMETQDGWMLIDLNSTNGCFVNGRRVHEHRLKDGDLISLGQHQLRFSGTHLETAATADKTMTAVALNPNLPRN
jgi:hypothetical protein